MTLPQIMERLLRSRLYRQAVTITTDDGQRLLGIVRDVRHEGGRSAVLLVTGVPPRAEVAVALERIAGVSSPPLRRPGRETVA